MLMIEYSGGYLPKEETVINSIVQENETWIECDFDCSIVEVLTIIDDSLVYCFEFKVENNKLYYREIL